MELRHIYDIASAIREKVGEGNLGDLMVVVEVSPTTHFAIDREFYRMTNDSVAGFKHTDGDIDASIDGVAFRIRKKQTTVD